MGTAPSVNEDGQITFMLVGAERDGGMVRMSTLTEFLDNLQECLRETERCVLGKKSTLTYIVHEMKVGSPAVGTIGAKKPRRGPDTRQAVFNSVSYNVTSFEKDNKQLDPRLDYEAMKSYRKVAGVIHRTDDKAKNKLVINGTVVTSKYIVAVDKAIEIQDSSYGSVTGVLEKIDVHGRNLFAIFPPLGQHQVTCTFKDGLWPKVQGSAKQTVTVSGMMHYISDRLFPARMDADDIETHPPIEELPRLTSMAGLLSHLPGDSVTIARKIRDGWDD